MKGRPMLRGSNKRLSNSRTAPDTRRIMGQIVDSGRYNPDKDLNLKQFVKKIDKIEV